MTNYVGRRYLLVIRNRKGGYLREGKLDKRVNMEPILPS